MENACTKVKKKKSRVVAKLKVGSSVLTGSGFQLGRDLLLLPPFSIGFQRVLRREPCVTRRVGIRIR